MTDRHPSRNERFSTQWARAMKLGYTTPELVFYRIDIDATCSVLVIGGDGEGAYEWVIVKDGAVERYSNCGYGICDIALRDGLIACYGLPPADGYFMREIAAHDRPTRRNERMNADNGKPDAEQGVYRKYNVERLNDPTGKHADCYYYVLDLIHDRHAAPALEAYATSCEAEYPKLAKDLREEASRMRAALGLTRSESGAMHHSAPKGRKCADCTIDNEPCPTCYCLWWSERHPSHREV